MSGVQIIELLKISDDNLGLSHTIHVYINCGTIKWLHLSVGGSKLTALVFCRGWPKRPQFAEEDATSGLVFISRFRISAHDHQPMFNSACNCRSVMTRFETVLSLDLIHQRRPACYSSVSHVAYGSGGVFSASFVLLTFLSSPVSGGESLYKMYTT